MLISDTFGGTMEHASRALVREQLHAQSSIVVFYETSNRVFPVRMRVRFSRWLRARIGR